MNKTKLDTFFIEAKRDIEISEIQLVIKKVKPCSVISFDEEEFPLIENIKTFENMLFKSQYKIIQDPELKHLSWIFVPGDVLRKKLNALFIVDNEKVDINEKVSLIRGYYRSNVSDTYDKSIEYSTQFGNLFGYPPQSVQIFAQEIADIKFNNKNFREDRLILTCGKQRGNVAFITYPEVLNEATAVMEKYASHVNKKFVIKNKDIKTKRG